MNPSFSRGLKLGLSSGEVRSIIRLLGGTGLVATPRVQMSEWYFMRALLSSLPVNTRGVQSGRCGPCSRGGLHAPGPERRPPQAGRPTF